MNPNLRFTAERPCPVCSGNEDVPRGTGGRCWGFASEDGKWAHCTREEFAFGIVKKPDSETYAHRLEGRCRCGKEHLPGNQSLSGGNGRPAYRGPLNIVKVYDYFDESNVLRFQVARLEPKSFRQRRPDGNGGWLWNMEGVKRIPYRLPELLKASPAAPVLIVEGEKDADRAAADGLVATTNPGGALKWQKEFGRFFKGRHVVIIPDNDDPDSTYPEGKGLAHAEDVASKLHGLAEVKILPLPIGKDYSDWRDAGGTPDQLLDLIQNAAQWMPPSIPSAAPSQAGGIPDDVHLTDLGNAERLTYKHGKDILYCDPWKTWFVWDGKRWREDTSQQIKSLAHDTVKAIYLEAASATSSQRRGELADWAMKSEFRARIDGMLSQAMPYAAVTPDKLDKNKFLMNVSNGTLNLKTGELQKHSREDLITKLSPVDFDVDAHSELWEKCLETWLGGNVDLIAFLRRAVGSCLTGDTQDEKLFFIHGRSRTGKSTFLEAVKAMMGDYALTADFDTFVKRDRVDGRPRDDIAQLQGRRLVISIEVDEGKRLAEGLVKTLTGGDTIRARELYKSGFEFKPEFKLWLAANHAPRVRDDDEAIWERILRIPFDKHFEKAERDPTVKKTLCDTAISGPAILAWAFGGCLEWMVAGLGVPPAVEAATLAYREEQDPLKEFLEDCCNLGPENWVASKLLREAYEAWGKGQGSKWIVRGKEWGERLRNLGCVKKTARIEDPESPQSGNSKVMQGWLGINLKHYEEKF